MIHHVVPHRTTLMKRDLASANVKVAHTTDLPCCTLTIQRHRHYSTRSSSPADRTIKVGSLHFPRNSIFHLRFEGTRSHSCKLSVIGWSLFRRLFEVEWNSRRSVSRLVCGFDESLIYRWLVSQNRLLAEFVLVLGYSQSMKFFIKRLENKVDIFK